MTGPPALPKGKRVGLKDELHDVKVLGGVRNYLLTLWQLRVVHEWDARRYAAEKARAERKERRLMKTSTYDALAERTEPGLIPDNIEQMIHEDLLADTIAVERRRWIERAAWITLAVITAGLGWVGGWYAQPEFQPGPVSCDIKVMPDAPLVEPRIVRCTEGEATR